MAILALLNHNILLSHFQYFRQEGSFHIIRAFHSCDSDICWWLINAVSEKDGVK